MTTQAGDTEDAPPPLGCGERATLGGMAGLVAGFPAQATLDVVWHIPVGTSVSGLLAVAALVFGGALTGLLWPRRWRRPHEPSRNLQR